MGRMGDMRELIDKPLSNDELAVRYRALCDDPCLVNVRGKIELDVWGRLLITPPPSVYHGRVQANLTYQLKAVLGGHVITEAPIVTPGGLFLPDVAWASSTFMSAHRSEFALTQAPEICIEIVSPSNSVKELNEKRDAYLAAGAAEVWIIFPQSKRCEFYNQQGLIAQSRYAVDLSDLFS